MTQFGQAIQLFRSGTLTREQLLSEIDRQVSEQQVQPDLLRSELEREHAVLPFPRDVLDALSRRIFGWRRDATALPSAEAARTLIHGTPFVDDSRTILMDLADHDDPRTPAPRSKRSRLEIGAVLQDRFSLRELVGEGGMSRVYKAFDLRRVEAGSRDPYVAVKVLTVPFSHYFGSIQSLNREATKLQSLTHPNIVRVIDVDRDGQTVFMTMEFLSGEPLNHKLQRGDFGGPNGQQPEPIVMAMASALEFAHRAGIVHGDLKPGNVIMTDTGEVKVIDFGIARFIARPKQPGDAAADTQWEKLSAISPTYASPEMLEDQQPDPRDDVYALACIAYELFTGVHPFGRAAATEARDAAMTIARPFNMSGRQFRAISGGLQFDRKQRTPSAQAFAEAFAGKRSQKPTLMLALAALAVIAVLAGGLYLSGPRVRAVSPAARTAWTPGEVFRDCPTCPLMRVVPAGAFVQGNAGEATAQPVHKVTIAAPIAFASHEITIGEFREFAQQTQLPSGSCNVYDGDWRMREDIHWDNAGDAHTPTHPVSCVSWEDATQYAHWLSGKTGQPYRLPSAAEWEYAANAGLASSDEPQGAADICSLANVADRAAAQRYPGWDVFDCNDHFVEAAPVGSFAANPFGLNDMLGNVFEWVQDCWNDTYEGAHDDGSARLDGDCTQRETRGGSWFTSPDYLRASYRNRFDHDYRSSSVGFRVVREGHR
jgi:formylglycine-generating enzyme required for sulfatase activity/predicted Ser/Thr protein kinase